MDRDRLELSGGAFMRLLCRNPLFVIALLATLGAVRINPVQHQSDAGTGSKSQKCSNDSGLQLPPGFCATVFADDIGHARHMAVAPNGVVYVNTWSGVYYGKRPPHPGGFLVALQDKTG